MVALDVVFGIKVRIQIGIQSRVQIVPHLTVRIHAVVAGYHAKHHEQPVERNEDDQNGEWKVHQPESFGD